MPGTDGRFGPCTTNVAGAPSTSAAASTTDWVANALPTLIAAGTVTELGTTPLPGATAGAKNA